MDNNELHGLSMKEQATFLWALCRYSYNPETCAIILMHDLGGCPFECDCADLPLWAWLPILEKRIPPKENR